jgi:hypothetical protein
MQTKLTLSIDKAVIHKAKIYARRRKKSLSSLIEDYLKSISAKEQNNTSALESIPPITKSLAGILKGKIEIDIKSSISTYLENKYR